MIPNEKHTRLARRTLLCVLASFLVILCLGWTKNGKSRIPAKPGEQSFVFDYAGMLKEKDAATIRHDAQAIQKASTAEITVVTLQSIGEENLEEFANELYNTWGIGDKKKNNGVLILVNRERVEQKKNGRVRVEVGYGLEGALPDGLVGQYLDELALPHWEKGEYSQGILELYKAIAFSVREEYHLEPGEETAASKIVREESPARLGSTAEIIIIVMLVIIILCSRGRGHHSYWGGGGFGGGGFGGGSGFGGFGGGRSGGGGASR